MEDNFYTKDFNYYQLVCWQDYIKMNGLAILKELWKIEQLYYRFNGKERFSVSNVVSASDETLARQQGIDKRTVKKIVEKLEEHGLIKILSDRNDHGEIRKGNATKYLIVKPMPLPPVVKLNEDYIEWFGRPTCEKELGFIKELLGVKNVHLNQQNDTPKDENMPEIGEEMLQRKQNKKKKNNNEGNINHNVKDNVVVLENSKIKDIIENLSQIEAFSRFDIKKTVLQLLAKYPLEDLEYISQYYLKNGCRTNVRGFYPYLEHGIKHKKEYDIPNNNNESIEKRTYDYALLQEMYESCQ